MKLPPATVLAEAWQVSTDTVYSRTSGRLNTPAIAVDDLARATGLDRGELLEELADRRRQYLQRLGMVVPCADCGEPTQLPEPYCPRCRVGAGDDEPTDADQAVMAAVVADVAERAARMINGGLDPADRVDNEQR